MKKGFTLVELLAVITILSIIVAVALTSINAVRQNSLENIVETKLDLLEQAAILYGQENPNAINNTNCKEIVLKDEEGNGSETYKPSYCTTVTAGFLIDKNYYDSGYLDEENGVVELYNDVTNQSMRNDTVIIYRMNNRVYSIIDCVASNGETCS